MESISQEWVIHGENPGIVKHQTEPHLSADQIKNRSLQARASGKALMEKYQNIRITGKWCKKEDIHKFGGKENFLAAFHQHYQKLFSDPFMNTLFDTTNPDTDQSSEHHGSKLAAMFMQAMGDYDDYYKIRGTRSTSKYLNEVHVRAKNCPFRGKF